MTDEYLVGLDEYKVLDSENPIGYARDITSCMVVLIHKEKNSILMHIESDDNSIMLDDFLEYIKPEEGNKTLNVDIFMGKYTPVGFLSIIIFVLHRVGANYNVRDVFVNTSNETSVGYNFNTKDYYMVRMDKGRPRLTKKKTNIE